jgi:endonuclease/exonuclease/phosphatase (EEP) superfamily protein YafD
MIFLQVALYAIGTLLLTATILPLWRTSRWWVRFCDFPRFQIVIAAAAVIALLPLVSWPWTPLELAFGLALIAALLWQLSWVWHYLPFAAVEVESCSETAGSPNRLSLLTANVLQTSKDAVGLLEIIDSVEPDLVLTVETDEWWCARLQEGFSAHYPHKLLYPLSNGYGMALFSRLELVEPTIRFLVDEAIPSIKARIRLRSGSLVDIFGVHPQPPAPQQDSAQRDVELCSRGTGNFARKAARHRSWRLERRRLVADDDALQGGRGTGRSEARSRVFQQLPCTSSRLAVPVGLRLSHPSLQNLRDARASTLPVRSPGTGRRACVAGSGRVDLGVHRLTCVELVGESLQGGVARALAISERLLSQPTPRSAIAGIDFRRVGFCRGRRPDSAALDRNGRSISPGDLPHKHKEQFVMNRPGRCCPCSHHAHSVAGFCRKEHGSCRKEAR